MSQRKTSWNTSDLEHYHDEELNGLRRAELSAALRRDPALRERLAEVGRLDASIRAVLRQEHISSSSAGANADFEQQSQPKAALRWLGRFVAALAAACLLLMLTGGWWLSHYRGREPGPEMASNPHVHANTLAAKPPLPTDKSSYQAIRVVFSLPLRPRPAAGPPQESGSAEPVVADRRLPDITVSSDGVRLTALLAAGRIPEMLDLLSQTPGDQRVAACERLGKRLRAVSAAEQILDLLVPQEQLTVCRRWAGQHNLRPVVFARLRRFSKQARLHNEVRTIVSSFSRDPSLRGWVRGYQLPGPKPVEENVSS